MLLQTIFSLATILALLLLIPIALVTLLNSLSFPRLGKAAPSGAAPRVSLLVPARDEAGVIGATVTRLLGQDYPNFELLVLDDHSSDGTAARALQAAQGDARLRLLQGQPLPPGWTGKNWACWQLARQAQGELLVFSDADVHWEAGALRALVDWIERSRADVFTVWPTQQVITWAERLVVPMMTFAILAYLPELAVRYAPFASLAAANGQCLAFRRRAYELTGGHQAVRQDVVEDVALARLAKRKKLRLVMALGDNLIWGRMYTCWREVRQGFGKNILAGHAGSPLFLLVSTVVHWGLFLLPWLWLPLGGLLPLPGWPGLPLALVALGLGVRLLSAAAARHRLGDAFLLPLSVLLMTLVAGQSLWWQARYGGPLWKGRRITAAGGGDHA